MSKEKISIEYSGASDIGMVRTENQDSIGKFPVDSLEIYSDKGQLFIVADGIGGHAGGKEASSLAVETINKIYFGFAFEETASALKNAIEEANSVIHLKAKDSEKFGRMGTTCTTLVIKNDTATIGHVGDSKVYKIEKDKIEQLTMEHTQLNELLREKILTEEEAKNYPSKSVLSRALGMEEKIKVDIIDDIQLKKGQIFVLCTDGLANVSKEEILSIVTQNNPEDSSAKLINLANERGGKDNVTVQVLKINSEATTGVISSVKEERIKTGSRKRNKWFFAVPALVILLVIGFQYGNTFIKFFNQGSKEISLNDNNDIKKENIPVEVENENSLLKQADHLFKNGSYEKALIIYQGILEKEPMNLSVLNAINNIAGIFKEKADRMRSEKRFADALDIYLKVQKIQPENAEVKKSILLCENQVKFGESRLDNTGTNFQDNGINHSEWNFINIDKSHYEIEGDDITFFNTPFEKKSVLRHEISNASVSADIHITSDPDKNGAGIIFGYNISSGGSEKYYLLKFDEDNYILQHSANNRIEQLTVQKLSNKNAERNIGVKCSGNLINIYDGMNLIYSWKSDEKIYGKVGIYADKNVQVKFKNILVRGIKK